MPAQKPKPDALQTASDLGTPAARPVKHSLTLKGHRTSVSLEAAFWEEFRRLAAENGRSLNDLAAEIDARRGDVGLASAIRVHILNALRMGRAEE